MPPPPPVRRRCRCPPFPGRLPCSPRMTALSEPWPCPVAPSDPNSSAWTRTTSSSSPSARAADRRTGRRPASGRRCARTTARCRPRTCPVIAQRHQGISGALNSSHGVEQPATQEVGEGGPRRGSGTAPRRPSTRSPEPIRSASRTRCRPRRCAGAGPAGSPSPAPPAPPARSARTSYGWQTGRSPSRARPRALPRSAVVSGAGCCSSEHHEEFVG